MTTGFELFCLAILCLGLTMVVYALVWLHGIPHHIAEKNNHPHKRAIHHACWLSVFTLHAIWPIVYLWAIMPGQRIGVSVESKGDPDLAARVAELERRLAGGDAAAAQSTPVKGA
ncbi:MAG: inner membrane protein YiaW [Planctomycetota bacterium]|jgi:hypothetical protein